MEIKYYLTVLDREVYLDCQTDKMSVCTKSEFLRYLKGVHTNKERLISRFIEPRLEELKGIDDDIYNSAKKLFDFFIEFYDETKPFSFKEAFAIDNPNFRALVFGSINIVEMMNELGAERIKTDGIETTHNVYDENGIKTGTNTYHNIYEVYEVSSEKLELDENVYAVKCWCTSTNKEHFIWIKGEHKDDPLEAIASTFVVHKNIIPYIKALKRHGDILLVEMDENNYVKPEGEEVSLTKEQYFSLLKAQA